MAPKKLAPVHPGEILLEEFLEPLGISQYRLAKDVSVPPRRINEIVHGKRGITADTSLRLARYCRPPLARGRERARGRPWQDPRDSSPAASVGATRGEATPGE